MNNVVNTFSICSCSLFLFCCSTIQNPTTAFDIIEELRILRNSEEESRKRIAKHDTELATIKSELDPVRRYCDCWSTDNDELPGLKRTGDPLMPQLSENRIQKGRTF